MVLKSGRASATPDQPCTTRDKLINCMIWTTSVITNHPSQTGEMLIVNPNANSKQVKIKIKIWTKKKGCPGTGNSKEGWTLKL